MGIAILVFACLLGFAEATLFFIVPDVLLTFIVLRSEKLAAITTGCTLLGALTGGAVMYHWGATELNAALNAVERVPAINKQLIDQVNAELQSQGSVAIYTGAWQGRPYKIYAVSASANSMTMAQILLHSIPARLARFVVVVLVMMGIRRATAKWLSAGKSVLLLGTFWIIFYAAYWSHFGW